MSAAKVDWAETGDSALTHICYKENGQQIWVAYRSGNVYRFLNVPERWYTELKNAAKPAQFVERRLKGRFDMRRLQGFIPTTTKKE